MGIFNIGAGFWLHNICSGSLRVGDTELLISWNHGRVEKNAVWMKLIEE